MTETHTTMTYEGAAFDEQFDKGRASGTIEVTHGRVIFISSQGTCELLLRGLVIKTGGASERLIFLSHPNLPETSIYTSDHRILENPILLSTPGCQTQILAVRSQKTYGKLIIAGIIVCLIACIYSIYLLKDPLVATIAHQVPVSWENQLGEMVFTQAAAGKRMINDDKIMADLEKMTSPLIEAIDNERYDFRFHIIEEPTLNAFAIPGGHVVLHSGLILRADSSEEVIGVVAHEIAHVTGQHSLRQMISSTGVVLIVQAFFGDMEGILALITQKSAFLLMQKFSRDHEREADEVGFAYLEKARINPEGMITFFEKLKDEHKNAQALDETLNFLSTHPTTSNRIEFLRNKLESSKKQADYLRLGVDFTDFQSKIRGSLEKKE